MCDKNKIKIAIVDDHPMILEGLKSLFEKDAKFQVYAFSKGAAVLDFIQENPIDVVLLDIVLNDGSGLDFCKIIKQKTPQSIVIALSNQAERGVIFRFLENGGNGYVLKNADSHEIIEGIEKALAGDMALSKEVQEIMLSTPTTHLELPRLTKREKQILQAIAKGNTSAEIAELLFISVITVETHRRNLLQKFKAKNMMELITIVVENQLI